MHFFDECMGRLKSTPELSNAFWKYDYGCSKSYLSALLDLNLFAFHREMGKNILMKLFIIVL